MKQEKIKKCTCGHSEYAHVNNKERCLISGCECKNLIEQLEPIIKDEQKDL